MPLQNNGGSGGPWGGGGDGGPPKNPWGQGQPPRPPERDGERSSTPDFDDFIRRSQERLRASLPGGGSRGPGGERSGGGIPWSYIALGLLLAWALLTSTYRVAPQERAVVLRFGKYTETNGPGVHFKLPAPVDRVVKVRTEEVNADEIGGTASNENLMLTGDQNVINVAYTVRWKIADPVKFLFELAEPQATVREVAESAMRAEISAVNLNAAIGPQRAQIADAVRDRVQELLNNYNAGIQILGVDIKQADPPAAVDEAFKEVSASQQTAQRYLNDARAYSQELIAKAQGEAAIFNAVYEQYRLAPEVTRKRIYLETMEEVLEKNSKTVLDSKSGVTPYMQLPPPVLRAPADGAAR